MALELQVKRGAIDNDLTYFFMEDNTGLHDAVDNPGGYGTVNPDRTDLALYATAYKYRAASDDEVIAINNDDPLNVSQWKVAMGEDGYYYFRVLGFNIYDSLLPYVVNDLVYYLTKYYKAIDVASPGEDPLNNPLVWEEIADLTASEIITNPTIYTVESDQVVNYRAKQCYQTQVELEAEGCCDCHSKDRSKVKIYQKIFVHLNTASFNCLQQKYAQADATLQYLAEYCASINCPHCNS